MRYIWKFIFKMAGFSLGAIFCVMIIAYIMKLRWFMAVGSVVCLAIIWINAIMNYDDGRDEKARLEAMKMLGMKRKTETDMLNPMKELKKESAREPVSLDVPVPPPSMRSNSNLISEEDRVVLKIKGLKSELETVNVQVISLQEDIGKLEELYLAKKKAINDSILALEDTKIAIKDKIMELI